MLVAWSLWLPLDLPLKRQTNSRAFKDLENNKTKTFSWLCTYSVQYTVKHIFNKHIPFIWECKCKFIIIDIILMHTFHAPQKCHCAHSLSTPFIYLSILKHIWNVQVSLTTWCIVSNALTLHLETQQKLYQASFLSKIQCIYNWCF